MAKGQLGRDMRLPKSLLENLHCEDISRSRTVFQCYPLRESSFLCLPCSADQLAKGLSPERRRETLYLVAVGYFRAQEYTRSKRAVDEALRVSKPWALRSQPGLGLLSRTSSGNLRRLYEGCSAPMCRQWRP